MLENIRTTLDSLADLTGDATVIVDPRAQTIRYASARAVELIGAVLTTPDIPVSQVFQNTDLDFDTFMHDALTVTAPIMSTVTLRSDKTILTAKARRLVVQDGAPHVLVLLETKPELSQRFLLLSDKIAELRAEVSRRTTAEQELSATILSLRRSVSVIRQLSELDISSGDHFELAAMALSSAIETRGIAIISASQGRLKMRATTGLFAEAFDENGYQGMSLADFQRIAGEPDEIWKRELFSGIHQPWDGAVPYEDALVLSLFASGEARGALICLFDSGFLDRASARIEWDLIAEALGGMISRADIEARLIHAQKLQAIGQLTGGIAHDFNNILAVVMGNAELLLEEIGGLDVELAGEIRDAAARGATLTSRLLSFARKQPLKPEPTDANALLRGFDPLIRRTMKQNIDFNLITLGGLWETQVDRGQLENALLNLVVNARDAMPDGGRLTIETSNTRLDQDYADRHTEVRPGQYVMIAVSDTGHGMDPDTLTEAFTPFFTTKAVGKGSGLGLSMVFGFAKQSLGHVKIYSEKNLGTTVRMYFPRHFPDGETSDPQISSSNLGLAQGKGSILLVEDDPGVLKFLTRSLGLAGFDVHGVLSGEDGLARLKQAAFDILLTDVVLPGDINGAQLAKIAQQIAPAMPVLFMSGYTENSIVHHGRLDSGANFISKPFTREQLIKRLTELMPPK